MNVGVHVKAGNYSVLLILGLRCLRFKQTRCQVQSIGGQKKFEDARAEEFVPRIAQGKENGSAGGGPEEEEGSNQRAPGKGNSSTRGGQAPLPHV